MADQVDDSVAVALELKAENDRLRQRIELKDERIEAQREVIATYRDALAALQAEQQLRGALHLTDLAALSPKQETRSCDLSLSNVTGNPSLRNG